MTNHPLDKVDKSGWNKAWVSSLTDISAEEMKANKTVIENAPTKTCDVLRGCEEPVMWAVRFHDCHLYTACEEHCQLVTSVVMNDLCRSGMFICRECMGTFNRQPDVVRMWKI